MTRHSTQRLTQPWSLGIDVRALTKKNQTFKYSQPAYATSGCFYSAGNLLAALSNTSIQSLPRPLVGGVNFLVSVLENSSAFVPFP